MDEAQQIDLFNDALDKLVATFCSEHDVSSAALIGALYLKIHQLADASAEN
jgi:hypothetical protein